MEPVRLSSRVQALVGGVNCAIVELGGGAAMLVDTGFDKEYGRQLRKALDSASLEATHILCTHSHADHCGGNAYLLGRYPTASVWAPEIEADLIRTPILEPVYLYFGAKPLPELTGKFLMPKPSRVDEVVAAGPLELGDVTIELLDVRGHAHRQLAVLVDGVLLATDALFGPATLQKHPLPFSQDVGGQLAALDLLAGLDVEVVLPGHGEPTPDLAGLVEANRRAVEAAQAAVEAALTAEGATAEDVATAAVNALGSPAADFAQHQLNLATVAAHLGWLRESGRAEAVMDAGRMLWRTP